MNCTSVAHVIILTILSLSYYCSKTTAFSPKSQHRSIKTQHVTKLHISNLFTNQPSSPQLPKDVKEAVSKCRQAVQKGLEKKLSRMDIEFPVGTKFGVEKKSSAKKGSNKLASVLSDSEKNSSSELTREMLDTSDRELARLFVEMFQPLGGDHISVVFHDDNLADTARSSWKGDLSAECKVSSLNRGKKVKSAIKGMGGAAKGRKSKKKGFAAKMNEEFDDESSGPFQLPSDCELALFVSPTVKDLMTIKRICSDVGMGTLVVLLNARLSLIENLGGDENKEFFEDEFESIFYLSVAPQEAAPGCLMHRSYPNDWIVARKPKAGTPKTIAVFPNRPSVEECGEAFNSIEVGDMEKVAENVLDNVASWLN
mmetsp:Transcript_9366/g.10885  ORF Transcript_9366/g.10885 Transcript_9366/m.10885 type:complete len:369 (-) Transcript_9366:54-1160(-)